MGTRIYTAATQEPLTLAVARAHLNVQPYEADSSGADATHPDDEMIMAMLGAAREWAENFTGRSIALKTYEMAIDEFPDDEIRLPFPPVVSITSIIYVDADLQEQTIDASNYVLDQHQETEGWVKPATDYSWPATAAVMNAVKVRYVAGYQQATPESSDPAADPLPYAIRAALLLMLGHLYANRESVADRQTFEVPFAAEALLRPLRVRLGFA